MPDDDRPALVLNADGDEAKRRAGSQVLRRAGGFEVIEAATGAEASRLAGERRPALVLLGAGIPDPDGPEACRAIKKDRPDALVLRISAPGASGADRTRGLDTGADLQLSEPVEPAELVASARALLRIRRAEARLRESEERLRLVVDGAADHAIITTDDEGRITGWSAGAEAVFGWKAPEAIGQDAALLFTPGDRAAGVPRRELETARREGCAPDERWHAKKGGGRVFMNGSVRPLHDSEGRGAGFLKVARDETARQESHETAARLAAVVSATPDAVVSFSGEDGRIASWNKAAERLFGYTEAEAIGAPVGLLVPPPDRTTPKEDATGVFRRAMREGAVQVESVRRRKDGSLIDVAISAARMEARGGGPLGVSAIFRDITERKRAEAALRESEANFRTLADNIPALCWMADADGWIYWYNKRWYEYTGTAPDQMEGWGWRSVHDPSALPAVMERWTASIASGEPFEMVFPLKGADGAFRPFLTRVAPVRDGGGRVLRWFGTNADISGQRAAEERLRELNETLEQRVQAEVARRAETEERLRQSQKMEAVGQLTGGIAHDFNNLLQVVTGNLEILGRSLPADADRLRRAADNAMNGAKRAATLTQRLLAFSRRQPLAPKPLSPNRIVSGMSDLLNRALGETVALETVLAAGLWRVEADPNQLENAILNLAVNARDAMPGGGKLTIETANARLDGAHVHNSGEVSPGQYAVICVSDTGTGMDEETRARAFEPFFTTKEVGQGTGLGLTQVYGFVKQSGGHVAIYSEPGEGTIVKIYLPRLLGAAAAEDAAPEEPMAPAGSRAETVLVVEDDHDVRAFTAEVLRELGYRVLEAQDGPSALRLVERRDAGRIDLLFTDVVLPGGMNGEQVASRARELRPGLRVLFTTGYACDAIVHHGRLDPGVRLVTKPFAYTDLTARIRDLLDSPGP